MEGNKISVQSTSDTIKGLFFIALMVACMVSAVLIIKVVFGDSEVPFKNPLFVTELSSTLFIAYLIPAFFKWVVLSCKKNNELA